MGGVTEMKNGKEQGLVHLASIQGSMPTLALLKYEIGMNINEKDINQMTPLHLSAKAGNEHVVSSLIAWSSEVNALDIDNNTPLHLAAINGNYRVVRALVLAGSDRNALNKLGETPFILASRAGNTEILKILVIPN